MIKRAHIHQFLAIVETGSFTNAAQRIRVTQPTLSAGIAELERLTGSSLFVRDRKHIRMTEAGARFLPIARELQKGFRAADAFAKVPEANWPQLRMGAIRSLATPILQFMVEGLAADFTIEIVDGTDSDLRTAMGNGRIDMAVGLLRPNEAGAGIYPLFDEPYVMMVAEDHPFAGRKGVTLSDFASQIMIARRSCEVLDQTSRTFTRRGIRPRFALRSESEERCLAMVAAGIGVTTAPLSYVRPGIVAIAVEGYDLSRRIGLRVDPGWLTPATLPFFTKWLARLPTDRFHLLAAITEANA